jgi:hypothetical protein
MNIFPRSFWTSRPPTPAGVDRGGLPFFTDPTPQLSFHTSGTYRADLGRTLFYYRNPNTILHSLVKEAFNNGEADLPFNYAITQNMEGVHVISGRLNRFGDTIKVLMLIGNDEKPTDIIKKNQTFLKHNYLELTNAVPSPILRPGDTTIHVFDLIEKLIEFGVYKSRNDAYYGPLTVHAVKLLQDQAGIPISGEYNEYLYNVWAKANREYIYIA